MGCKRARGEEHALSLATRQIPKWAGCQMRQVESVKESVCLGVGLCPAHATGQQGQRDVVNRAARSDAEWVLEDPTQYGGSARQTDGGR